MQPEYSQNHQINTKYGYQNNHNDNQGVNNMSDYQHQNYQPPVYHQSDSGYANVLNNDDSKPVNYNMQHKDK